MDYKLIDNGDTRRFTIYWKLGDVLPDGTKLEITNNHGWIISRHGRGAKILDQLSKIPRWVAHNRLTSYLKITYGITKPDYYCIINHGQINLRPKCRVEGCNSECELSHNDTKYTYTTACKCHVKDVHSITMTKVNYDNWDKEDYRIKHSEVKQVSVNRSKFINQFGPDSIAILYLVKGLYKSTNEIKYKFGITHCVNGGRENGLRTYYKLLTPLETLFKGTAEEVAWLESMIKSELINYIGPNYTKGSEHIPENDCSYEMAKDIILKLIDKFKSLPLEEIKIKYK